MSGPRLNQAEVNALAGMTTQEAAAWFKAGFEQYPAQTAQILAALKQAATAEGPGGGPFHLAYDHAMAGIASLEHSALTKGDVTDVREFLRATAALGPDAAAFKADMVWMQSQQLGDIATLPSSWQAETAHVLHRELAGIIRSDPSDVIQGLKGMDRDALDGILASMLRHSGTGEQMIQGIIGDIARDLRDALASDDFGAARQAGEAAGFAIGELQQGVQAVAEDDKAAVARGAAIIEGTIRVIAALTSPLTPVVEQVEKPLREAVNQLEQIEKGEIDANAADLIEATGRGLRAGFDKILEESEANQPLKDEIRDGVHEGWGASQSSTRLDVGSDGAVPWSEAGHDRAPDVEAAAIDLSAGSLLLSDPPIELGAPPVEAALSPEQFAATPDLSEAIPLSALALDAEQAPPELASPQFSQPGPLPTGADQGGIGGLPDPVFGAGAAEDGPAGAAPEANPDWMDGPRPAGPGLG